MKDFDWSPASNQSADLRDLEQIRKWSLRFLPGQLEQQKWKVVHDSAYGLAMPNRDVSLVVLTRFHLPTVLL